MSQNCKRPFTALQLSTITPKSDTKCHSGLSEKGIREGPLAPRSPNVSALGQVRDHILLDAHGDDATRVECYCPLLDLARFGK